MNETDAGGSDQRGGLDTYTPASARIYDYLLNGKDNYQPDRDATGKLMEVIPEVAQLARLNRSFLANTVTRAAEAGCRQFIDIGTGIPTKPATHDLAFGINPDSHVVYVDNDPVALAHARAMLTQGGSDNRVRVVDGDARQPHIILADTAFRDGFIDWNQPVCVLMLLLLHFITDDDEPQHLVDTFRRRMASGSWVAVSHITDDEAPVGEVERFRSVFDTAASSLTFRSGAALRQLLSGFELDGDLRWLRDWQTGSSRKGLPEHRWAYTAVGRLS